MNFRLEGQNKFYYRNNFYYNQFFFCKLVIACVAIVSRQVSRGSWDEQAKLAIKLSIVRV